MTNNKHVNCLKQRNLIEHSGTGEFISGKKNKKKNKKKLKY